MKKLVYILILIISILPFCAYSQNFSTAGGYLFRHYNVKSYNAHPRNFSIAQDSLDIMYFGNAYGVLEFDGTTWRNIPLPNGNSALSLGRASNDGNIYVGAYNDFGQLYPDIIGKTNFKSLSNLINKYSTTIGGIIGIHFLNGAIFLQSYNGLYLINNKSISKLTYQNLNSDFLFSKVIENNLYLHGIDNGLHIYNHNSIQTLEGDSYFINHTIKDIIKSDDKRLIVLTQNGLFVLNNKTVLALNENTNIIIRNNQVRKVIKLNNGNLLVTTGDNGFYILDSLGNLLNHVNHANGFPCNIINDVYVDRRGGIWFALDNGIVNMELNSPLSYYGSADGLQGMGYAAALFDNKLYLGTSEGLFYCEWKSQNSNKKFHAVKGVKGQVWSLDVIENSLLCSQSEHLYEVTNDVATNIPSNFDCDGNWKISSLKGHPGYAIKGTYIGFQLYKKENGRWRFVRKLSGFEESARVFVQESDGTIWACHGNKGIYKVKLSDDLSRVISVINVNEKNQLPPDFFNDVSFINNNLIFSADDGPYKIDKQDKFVKFKELENVIGKNRYLNRMTQCSNGNISVFSGNEIQFVNNTISIDKLAKQNSFLKKITGDFIGGFEFIMPLDNDKVIIGAQDGFIVYNYKDELSSFKNYKTIVRRVVASMKNDSLLFAGTKLGSTTSSVLQLPYSINSLRISYSSLWFENTESIKYQYALSKGNDSTIHWSGWTNQTQVDFSNQREGNYNFRVRAMNNYGELSQIGNYTFRIKPPWFRSMWAYAMYSLLLLTSIFFLIQYSRKKYKALRERMNAQKEKELWMMEQRHLTEKLLTEKELFVLRTEKLEAEMIVKNNELASLAATLAQKTELLSYLKDKLDELPRDSAEENSSVIEVIKTIDQDLEFDNHWDQFQKHFDEIHTNFLHRIREKYPRLNSSWLLLCAYIKMNKSNKEIAALLNISVAGVEKRKYRLREKLGMESEGKLSDFISGF